MSQLSHEEADDDYYYDDSDDNIDVDADDDPMDEMEDDAVDFQVVPEREKPKSYDIDYKSLSQDEVRALLNADVEYVVSIFGLDADIAQVLLRDFSWNRERLVDKYMENPSEVAIKAGVEVRPPVSPVAEVSGKPVSRGFSFRSSQPTSPLTKQPSTRADEPFACPICCDTEPPSVLSLKCGHKFCSECWSSYLTSKVKTEGECNIRCMETDCALLVPNAFVHEVLDKPTQDRFEELILRHYVANMTHLKYCPAPSCTFTISCPAASGKMSLTSMVPSVTCQQGHTFCFGCSIDSDHRPVICVVARSWLKKCQDDSETANWIKTNTKECSKCQSTIEKNGGCNHMTCKKCKHEFCWVCMGPWSEHGTAWYNCNRFDDKSAVDARDAQSKSRISLERYLHYYNRWANHEQSARLSKDLYIKTEKKMEEMQLTTELTWIEVQFLKKALEESLKARMTLKWTYAMAYYLERSNPKELFEDNQRDLEKAVEDLAELMESSIEPETIPALRQKITDKTVYVSKRNEIMLDDTAAGFREDRWAWTISTD